MALVDEIYKATKYLEWWNNPGQFFKDIFKQEPYPYQAQVLKEIKDLIQNQRRNIRIMIMAAGGTGKTKLLAAISIFIAVVASKFIKEPYSIIIISGSRDQARFLYEYARIAFLDNPILAEEVEGEPLMSITRLKDRSVIKAVPNSLKAIQGEHNDVVIVDEAPLAGDFIIRDTLRIVSQSNKDIIILSGTPINESMGAAGELFIEMWEDENKYPGWIRKHWSAKDCPKISIEKYIEAEKHLSEDMFSVFWEGKPVAKTDSLVPLNKLKEATRGNPIFKYDPEGGPVFAGIDWGYTNPTALVIVQYDRDLNNIRVLYTQTWRLEEFETIHEQISRICKEYRVEKIYADAEDIGENQRLEARGLNVIPIGFNQNKLQMQTRLKLLFHQNRIKIPEEYIELITQLRKYNWDTIKGEDLVDALMLAVYEDPKGIEDEYYFKIV